MKQALLSITVASVLFTSCVSSKKYKSVNAQNAALNSQVAGLNAKVADNEKQINQLKAENIQYGNEAEDCRKMKAAVNQKMENFNKALAEKGTSMKQIEAKIETAINKFEDAGATVTYKSGRVHVNFEDDFFFRSGSSTVGPRGREALNTVAEVMRENPGITVTIVGNTDTMHVKGIADNWSLSTERANAVVRVLHDTYYINPARLTAAGRGKYNPVASNATEAGREKNRRIEIVFNPDLDRIWDLME